MMPDDCAGDRMKGVAGMTALWFLTRLFAQGRRQVAPGRSWASEMRPAFSGAINRSTGSQPIRGLLPLHFTST